MKIFGIVTDEDGYKFKTSTCTIPIKTTTTPPTNKFLEITGNFTTDELNIDVCDVRIENFSDFQKLIDQKKKVYATMAVVIVDVSECKQCPKGDYFLGFDVIDESVEKTVRIRIFKKQEFKNCCFEVGDVIVISDLMLIGTNIYITKKSCEIYRYCPNTLELYKYCADSKTDFFKKIDDDEEIFFGLKNDEINGLGDETADNDFNDGHILSIKRLKMRCEFLSLYLKHFIGKFLRIRTISNLIPNTYCDFVGKVISKQIVSNNLSILTMTDFTTRGKYLSNEKLSENDEMLLYLKLWGKHSTCILNIEINDFIMFTNIKIKSVEPIIAAQISESQHSRIIKFSEQNVLVEIIKERELKLSVVKNENGIPIQKRFSYFKLTSVAEFLKDDHNKIFKLKVVIKHTIPFEPIKIHECIDCDKNCKLKKFYISAVLCDGKNSFVASFLDNIILELFKEKKFLRKEFFEALILKHGNNDPKLNLVIDASFIN